MFRRTLLFSKGKLLLVLIFVSMVMIVILAPSVKRYPMKVLAPVWPHNQSRNAESYAKPSFILEPDFESKYLTVFITSSPKNVEKRNSIRKSWAKDPPSNVQILFLLGLHPSRNESLQNNITSEAQRHNDILQGDFEDSYVLLSVKSLVMLQWYLENSSSKKSSCRYLLKTDDDVYIHLRNLLELTYSRGEGDLLLGSLICNALPIRDPYNKYYTPRFMFSARKYPPYLSGTGYLLSRLSAEKLANASLSVPIFHLEDVYITGLLASEASLRREDHLGFSYVKRPLSSPCTYNSSISSHELSPEEMTSIHDKIMHLDKKCPKIKKKFLRPYGHPICSKKKTVKHKT